MATATVPMPSVAAPELEGEPVDLTADEFFAMIEAGLFAPGRRVSLWGGRIYEKMAKTPSHAIVSYILSESLRVRLPAGWLVWSENPVRLDPRHVPLPDITLIRGPIGRYRGPRDRRKAEDRHPDVADVGLVVEIAVSSLPNDLGARAAAFARALVPSYWVADVFGGRIVEHRDPQVIEGIGRFGVVESRGLDDEVPLVLEGREVARIPVREMLG